MPVRAEVIEVGVTAILRGVRDTMATDVFATVGERIPGEHDATTWSSAGDAPSVRTREPIRPQGRNALLDNALRRSPAARMLYLSSVRQMGCPSNERGTAVPVEGETCFVRRVTHFSGAAMN